MKLLRAALALLGLVACAGGALASSAVGYSSSDQASNRIFWQGNEWYLHGANVPWFNWSCDFGCGTNRGVSDPAASTELAATFARAKAAGLQTIRWWMFEGDPWQITRDSTGAATGINPVVYRDVDAALQLAETYDLYFDFVLFSSPTSVPSAWLTDSTQRTRLANALGPLFAHYRTNTRVLSWEVFNEPEWDIWANKIDQAAVQATVRAIADSVHANSAAYVTVGSATLDGLPMWFGQGLDYYQAHWYDPMSAGTACARCTDYAAVRTLYHLERPLVIGEFYAGTTVDALARFEDFYLKGYAGAWPWSLFPSHTADLLGIDLTAAGTFSTRHEDAGPRTLSSAAPPSARPFRLVVPQLSSNASN